VAGGASGDLGLHAEEEARGARAPRRGGRRALQAIVHLNVRRGGRRGGSDPEARGGARERGGGGEVLPLERVLDGVQHQHAPRAARRQRGERARGGARRAAAARELALDVAAGHPPVRQRQPLRRLQPQAAQRRTAPRAIIWCARRPRGRCSAAREDRTALLAQERPHPVLAAVRRPQPCDPRRAQKEHQTERQPRPGGALPPRTHHGGVPVHQRADARRASARSPACYLRTGPPKNGVLD
jgi:hypothetical protein